MLPRPKRILRMQRVLYGFYALLHESLSFWERKSGRIACDLDKINIMVFSITIIQISSVRMGSTEGMIDG
mgnify:CR=1 FL=1